MMRALANWAFALILMVVLPATALAQESDDQEMAAPAVDATGTWTITTETPRGSRESTITLVMDEHGALTGTVSGRMGESEISDGQVSGNDFSFVVKREFQGNSMTIGYKGTIDENDMKGTVSFGDRFSSDFTGTKAGGDR